MSSAQGTKPGQLRDPIPTEAPASPVAPFKLASMSGGQDQAAPQPTGTPAPPAAPQGAKPPFDPNAAFTAADATSEGPKPSFDPNKPFEPAKPQFDPDAAHEPVPEDHSHLLTKYLPTIGGIAGGLGGAALGTLAAPGAGTVAGEIAGSGVGAASGSLLKDKVDNWLFNEHVTPEQMAKNAAVEGGVNALATGVGGAVLKGAKVAGGALLDTAAGQVVKNAAGKVADGVGSLAAKAGEFAFGVPDGIIKKYTQAADVIGQMTKSSGGDVAEAADSIRQGFAKSLQSYRAAANAQITKALENSPKSVDATKVIDHLELAEQSLSQGPYTEQAKKVGDLITKLHESVDANGEIPLSKAYEMKQYLQDVAKSSYGAPGEAPGGTKLAGVAKGAAALMRTPIHEAAPEIAAADSNLSRLYAIEQNMNKNLVRTEKPEAGLVTAGQNLLDKEAGNARNARALVRLTKLTGQDFMTPAQNLAVMKTLGNASLKRAGIGAAVGGTAGAFVGGQAGHPYEGAAAGATLGGALTSPLALKKAIDLGRAAVKNSGVPAEQLLGHIILNNANQQQGEQ